MTDIMKRTISFTNETVFVLNVGYLIKNMNIMSQDFSFRKGESNDIISLESCRIKSIENCKIYSEKQIDVWRNSRPNWEELIPNTIVCIKEKLIVGFVVSDNKFLEYLYVDPDYQKKGIGNQLVSLVEKSNMRCDCNPYSEKILIRRGWKFLSENLKEKSGEKYENKWFIFEKYEKPPIKTNQSLWNKSRFWG